jgi:hypothetical protein
MNGAKQPFCFSPVPLRGRTRSAECGTATRESARVAKRGDEPKRAAAHSSADQREEKPDVR